MYYDEFGYPVQDNDEGSLPPNEYMIPQEVMAFLSIGRNTFYRLVNFGELTAFRIGNLWALRRYDFLTFVK